MLTPSLRLSPPLQTVTQTISRIYTSATPPTPSRHLLQLLQFSIDHESLETTKQSHAQIYAQGFHQDTFLATKLVTAYSICGSPPHSRMVFNSIQHKNVFLCNSLMSGYVKNQIFKEPLYLFDQMRRVKMPDNYTFSIIFKICVQLGDLKLGKMSHCVIIKIGFCSDTVLVNSLMSMYFKCESSTDAHNVFDEMAHKSVASWNLLISENVNSGGFLFSEEIRKLVKQMQTGGFKPDSFTVASLLPLCAADCRSQAYGREIHCFVIRNGLGLDSNSDLHVASCLIDMYSKAKNVTMGRRVFEQMHFRNVVSWTAMMAGYTHNGCSDEALSLFRIMQIRDGIVPNRVSLLTVLPACGSIAGLMEGKQIHGFAIRRELTYEVSVSNALIDMYAKCGRLDFAKRVFDDDSFCKDMISWSSMIFCYGLHGSGEEAVVLYNKMRLIGIKPDDITLVGVLSACCRAGLISEGYEIYNSLTTDYGISPTVEICSCMVDMLGRAGQLDRALHFINSMPVKPGPSTWGALFGASVIHGNSDMRDFAYGFLLQLEPENPSNYISLSNVYASSGRWDNVAEVRMHMKEIGLRKLPGCSWITVNSKIHSFYVADKSHPCSDLIYSILDNLVLTMKGINCFPDIECFT